MELGRLSSVSVCVPGALGDPNLLMGQSAPVLLRLVTSRESFETEDVRSADAYNRSPPLPGAGRVMARGSFLTKSSNYLERLWGIDHQGDRLGGLTAGCGYRVTEWADYSSISPNSQWFQILGGSKSPGMRKHMTITVPQSMVSFLLHSLE
jgi:hypothetical protein